MNDVRFPQQEHLFHIQLLLLLLYLYLYRAQLPPEALIQDTKAINP